MKILEVRTVNRLTGHKLRRARRLYIRLVYTSCLADETGITLNRCVINAKNRFLYSEKSHPKDVRWSFLRRFWKLTPGYEDNRGWFRWFAEYGLRQARFDNSAFDLKVA